MEIIKRLERIGYSFKTRLFYEYVKPNGEAPPEAETFLRELAKHKTEVILYFAERAIRPSRTIISEKYRTAITKGIQTAQNPYDLLIQAIRCISDMTGDAGFYAQNEESIKAIYGIGLGEPAALEIELAEIRKRLEMLTRPELNTEPEYSRRRIDTAIKKHREREAEIIKMMGAKTDETHRKRFNDREADRIPACKNRY